MKSIWEKDIVKLKSVELKEKIYDKDIIVVGGGIAGIMCAHFLSDSGHSVTLIEAEKMLGGVTVNTTAHINALQSKYAKIPTTKKRNLYYKAQTEAVAGIENLVNTHSIDCDFEKVPSYVFGSDKSRKELKKEFKVLKKINAPVEYLHNENFLFGNFDAIKLENQAVFNPIKFLQGLPRNFEIIENTRIKKVSLLKKILYTETKTFRAKKIIFATNFPIVNIRGLYAFKMYKSISYALSVKTEKRLDAMFDSIEGDGITYRDHPEGIIIGGLDHRTGRIKCTNKFDQLEHRAKVFGGKITNRWVANDCMTFDEIPYAGRLKRFCSRDIYLISGFAKWGMTNSYVSAKIITDLINKEKNLYARIYKPKRILNIKVWPKFIFNALYNVIHILKSFVTYPFFKSSRGLKARHGGVVRHRLRKRAVYKDENGQLFVLDPRCPHMRCELKFNPNTKTWDCPCHGSRLTVDGQIITAPTIRSNKLKK